VRPQLFELHPRSSNQRRSLAKTAAAPIDAEQEAALATSSLHAQPDATAASSHPSQPPIERVLQRWVEFTQSTSEHFQELLKEQGITCSMSRAGEVRDNSAMESFFSSLKTERTARKVFRTREPARAEVFDYVERFYNPTRRHSTLGYLSPMAFEKAIEA
jgi:putative transposase